MGVMHYTTLKLQVKELGEGDFFRLSFAGVHKHNSFICFL